MDKIKLEYKIEELEDRIENLETEIDDNIDTVEKLETNVDTLKDELDKSNKELEIAIVDKEALEGELYRIYPNNIIDKSRFDKVLELFEYITDDDLLLIDKRRITK